jgi:hypothetical protein
MSMIQQYAKGSHMRTTIEKVLEAQGLLERFKSHAYFYAKILNPPWMPLSIERQQAHVIIAHYFEQNGDLVPDPDMKFEILANGNWVPVAIQNALGHYREAIYFDGEKKLIRPREFKDQLQFANLWSRNIRDQGFAKGTVENRGTHA